MLAAVAAAAWRLSLVEPARAPHVVDTRFQEAGGEAALTAKSVVAFGGRTG